MGLFSAVGSYFGPWGTVAGAAVDGYLGKKDAEDARQDTQEDNEAQRLVEYQRQKEFAQMGIRWKAEDAKAAGFHPAVALGATGSSYSPTVVAGSPANYQSDSSVFDSLASSGQNTQRAQMATKTDTEKQMEALTLRNAELRNSLLEGQISALWASVLGQPSTPSAPAAVGASVAPVGAIKVQPSVKISSRPGDRGIEAADTPGFKQFNVSPNVAIELPGQAMSESIESMGPGAGPVISTVRAIDKFLNPTPPSVAAPAGYSWSWSPFKKSWSLKKQESPNWTQRLSGGRGSARR